MPKLRVSGVVPGSITDGPGIRYAIFVQGCAHACPGCQNPETHDYGGGYDMDTEDILAAIKKDPMIMGVTFSGGEPFDQPAVLTELGREIKAMGLELAAYTGYIYESLLERCDDKTELLKICDVLIDGPFIMAQRNLDIRFKGSENQRIIDVPASLEKGEAVLKEDGRWIASPDEFTIRIP